MTTVDRGLVATRARAFFAHPHHCDTTTRALARVRAHALRAPAQDKAEIKLSAQSLNTSAWGAVASSSAATGALGGRTPGGAAGDAAGWGQARSEANLRQQRERERRELLEKQNEARNRNEQQVGRWRRRRRRHRTPRVSLA